MKNDRRDFIKKSSSLAAAFSVAGLSAYPAPGETDANKIITTKPAQKIEWPIADNPNTPRICVGLSMDADENTIWWSKKIGMDYVLIGGLKFPWTEEGLRTIMNSFK